MAQAQFKIRFDCYDRTAPEYAAWDGILPASVCFAEGEAMVRIERAHKCNHKWTVYDKSHTGAVMYTTCWCKRCGTLREGQTLNRKTKYRYLIPEIM